jgi:FkbM family methyltransferase
MIPARFKILRPYLAGLIHQQHKRPPVREIFYWLTQPGKEARARRFIDTVRREDPFWAITFKDDPRPFYYPQDASWIDFCQTVDECYNPHNWHHFVDGHTPLAGDDTVVDCGAAEGLFSYQAAAIAKQVYAIEPIPFWHSAMERTFEAEPAVCLVKAGLGHKEATVRMTNQEIYSRIADDGEITCAIKTIDALFVTQPITFLKADVEGFEFPLLLGAEEVIRRDRPKISITVYHDANHWREISEFLLRIQPRYTIRCRGLSANGHPVLLQAW